MSCFPLFTLTVENVKDEGEGEEEEQWLTMETAEVGGELLSTLHYSREKEKGKRKSSGWRWKQRRSVVSCSPLSTVHVKGRRGRGRAVAGSENGGGWW
jgi:hypothetical protein